MRERLIVLIFGVLFALFLFEAGLRAAGFFSSANSARPRLTAHREESIKVLCIGNSFTAGGLGEEENFPVHLQQLLNEHEAGRTFEVINMGFANANTAEILANLPGYMKKFSPDIVLLHAGTPNLWNRYKYSDYLRRKGTRATVGLQGTAIFHEIRVLRFLTIMASKLVSYQPDDNVNPYERRVVPARYREAEEWIRQMCNDPGARKMLSDQVRVKNAEAVLREDIAVTPKNATSYALLAELLMMQGRYPEAARICIRGIENAPDFRDYEENRCYFCLRLMKEHVPDVEAQRIIAEFEEKSRQFRNKEIFYNLMTIPDSKILDWVADDINQMVDMIRDANIRLILHNYPPRDGIDAAFAVQVNAVLRGIAKHRDIPFVDHERLFQNMWDNGIDRKDYHVTHGSFIDMHLNTKGYRQMAVHLIDTIRQQGSLPRKKILQ